MKTNVSFQTKTFEIECRKSFDKKLESWYFSAQNIQIWEFRDKIFEKKCQIWNQHLQNRLRAKFLSKIRKLILFGPKCQNLGIWLEIWKTKDSRKFQISPTFKNLVVLVRFAIFWVILAGFGSFRFLPGFGKYGPLSVF